MKLKIPAPKLRVCSVGNVLKQLGNIDKGVKAGKISERGHDILSRKVLKGCLK